MKRFLPLITAVLLSTAPLYSQWTLQSNPAPTTDEIYAVFPVSATTVYAVSEKDLVLKTTNAGANWIRQKEAVGSRSLQAIWFLNENTGFVAGEYDNTMYIGVISKTTNGGANWKDTIIASTGFRSICFVNANTGFAGGSANTTFSPMYKTTNAGVTWFSTVINAYNIYDIDFINESTGWAAATATGGEAVLKTTDGGINWSIVSSIGGSISLCSIDFANANTGWISGNMGNPYRGLLRKSTDGGVTWIQQTNHNTNLIWQVFFLNENTGWAAGEPQLFQKTTNGGINWNLQSSPAAWWIWDVKFFNENVGWASGSQGKIFHTTNGGGPVSVQNISTEMPSSFSLSQNYPNPFNARTKISFKLPVAGLSALKVFDITGKEVATLVNEKLPPGTYEITFDGSGLNSGVYFYRLIAGNFIKTRKLILLK